MIRCRDIHGYRRSGERSGYFYGFVFKCPVGNDPAQEGGKSLESLQKLSSPEARVVREGQSVTIPSSNVVPGD